MGELSRSWRRQFGLLKLVMAFALIGGLLWKSVAGILPLLAAWAFLVSPLMAIKKGYAPYYWSLACGPIGLLVLVFLPSLSSAKNPEEYERLETQANFIGAVLSWIGVFVAVLALASFGFSAWLL